jgi:putative ABC transport system substrate-binding protein
MGLGAGALVAPFGSFAQQKGNVARVGILVVGVPDPAPFLKPFREKLRELGYVEGQNMLIEFRSAEGKPERLPALAAELVGQKVDIIVTFQTPTAVAAKKATSEIPIVMSPAADPIAIGLIASLARPGGNVTGVTSGTAEIGPKLLQLIREILPGARRVAVLANANDPFHKSFLQHIQAGARTLGIEIRTILLRGTEELNASFVEMEKARSEAVIVQPSLPLNRAAELALKHRLPAFTANPGFPGMGGLMSYSADVTLLYREAAVLVDKIIKGRKPADLPVQQPTKFELVINMKTAKALGIKFPQSILVQATKVIE